MGKSSLAVLAAMFACATVAHAQYEETPNVSFDGFATLGVVHSDEDHADFAASLLVPEGVGHSREWSPEVDSRVGLQLTTNITPRLAGVVQIIAEQRHDGRYQPALEWANLSFELTPQLSIRAGRVVLPNFLVSEYRKVGYVTPWVRPPQEIYNLVPVTSADGIDLSYRSHFNGFTNTLRGVYGRRNSRFPGGTAEARDGLTVADTLEYGATTLFAQYSRTTLNIDAVAPFFDAFRRFGPAGEVIADRFDLDDKRFQTISLGLRHDPGDWFVMGEWARSSSRSFLGDLRGWYVTGGFRHGDLTPYATLARVQVHSATSAQGLPLAGLPASLVATASGLNAGLNQLLAGAAAQKSLSLGMRWDFTTNAALKAQYDHLDLDAGSAGVLINTQPGFNRGGSVNLFSLTLDVVF